MFFRDRFLDDQDVINLQQLVFLVPLFSSLLRIGNQRLDALVSEIADARHHRIKFAVKQHLGHLLTACRARAICRILELRHVAVGKRYKVNL